MDDTIRRLRDRNLSWSPNSLSYVANQNFMKSLRKYPDPKYSNLIEIFMRNLQNKHLNKTKNISKINKTTSKRTQTFNKTNMSIENIALEYEKMFFINQYNESYDYLNASRDQRSSWAVPNLEARYLYDLKKYIKRKLRQLYDETSPSVCNDIRNRYERHRREHHQHRISSASFTEPPKKTLSQCTICYRPKPCSCNNDRTLITPRESYEDRLYIEITEWTSKLPIFLNDLADNNEKRKEMVDKLVTDIQKLRNDVDITEYNDKVRNIAEDFLKEYPMWSPHDQKKQEEFLNYLVDDLIHKLTKERKDSKDIIYRSEEDILKMLNNIASNESKEDIIKEVLKRLKPLGQECTNSNSEYKQNVKIEAIDVLNKMSNEKNLNYKDDIIKDLAEKLSDYLTSIRRQESQSSQTDYQDKHIKNYRDSKVDIKSEATLKHESNPMISGSDHSKSVSNDSRQSSKIESDETNNQPIETHASKSLLRSFSRMLPVDQISLDDTTNISDVKQVPSRKTSLKLSHKRWLKKERTKHKSRKDSNNPIDMKDAIEDQAIRANNSKDINNTSQIEVDDGIEIIKSVHYPIDRTMSTVIDSVEKNASNKKIAVDVLPTPSSTMNQISIYHPNTQKISEAIQEWIDNLPVNLNETKETLTRSLTSDIEVRQKFKDLRLDNENNDVGFLKYYIFKHLCQVLSNEQLRQVIHEVDNLMQKLDNLHISQQRDVENENTEKLSHPSSSQDRRKSVATPIDNNKTNEAIYLSEDEDQNDFISNINDVLDKNSGKQSKEQSYSSNKDDNDLLQQIRERSMLYTDQSILDDISKEIAKETEVSKNTQEISKGNDKKSPVTQTKDTAERSIQVNGDKESSTSNKNSEAFDNINQNDVDKANENFRECNKNILPEDTIGCDGELYQSEMMNGFPNCIFCRKKYAAEAKKRYKRLKRRSSQENVEDDNHILCPKCGLKCAYPSRLFFC